ncbi:MAG: response regulator, partial [Planctomycetes bacterium]|nr:response regulator [Planctomycetota bacterium]
AEDVEFLVPWLLLEDARAAMETRRLAEFERALAAAEAKAELQGNLRVLAVAANFRGNGKAMARDADGAALHYAASCERFTRLGDRLERALATDMRAFVEMKRERLDAAEEFLLEGEALCAERGMDAVEDALLQTRFQLAVARSDGPAAAAIAAEIQRRKDRSIELDARLVAAREELRKAEEEHVASEERMRAEGQAAAALARSRNEQLVAALVVTLALLVAISWWSRRRLLRGHRELTEQFERAEAAQRSRDVLEQRMRQMQQAESLGTLAAGVAHDFNNLLTSVLGSTELLRMRSADPETRSLLDTIETAGRQAARLCKQLQTYGGDEPLDAVPVDLANVVRQILPVLGSSTRGRVEIRFVPPGETVGAFADATQIDQLLLNLVVNAADARAHSVTITLARREQAQGFEGPAAVLTVEDDGDGMTHEVAQRIFDPFFTTRFPGRGLGLAVVHGVVRRHGGAIHVDSAPGLGAKFVIELPLAIVAPGGSDEPIVVLPQQAPRAAVATRVLVVDDEPEVGRVLVRMLGMLGHPADCIGSGAEALRWVEAHPRDVALTVFVDLTMPEMDGDELIQRLRLMRADARVVLMSGHTQEIVERAAAAHAPDAVLAKPFQLAAVRAAVGGSTFHATSAANE